MAQEGVAFFRRLLAEPEIPMPYKHPLLAHADRGRRFLSLK